MTSFKIEQLQSRELMAANILGAATDEPPTAAWKLDHVLVTSYQTGGSQGAPVDTFHLTTTDQPTRDDSR